LYYLYRIKFGFSEEEFWKLDFRRAYIIFENWRIDTDPNYAREKRNNEFLDKVWKKVRSKK